MKIGILGTRGIPNHYGGFEQFAEFLSVDLVSRGHQVSVYNSHKHTYQEPDYKGVQIIHCFDPEYKIGTAGQFIYDFNCIRDARQRDFDILLQLGYTSSSIWSRLLPKKQIIITNMDGLEWKRSKFSKGVQRYLKRAESWAVKSSDYLVADSIGIHNYLKKKYNCKSQYIAYGAESFTTPNPTKLDTLNLKKNGFDMLIARLEPENSIEMILEGRLLSKTKRDLLVIGNNSKSFGIYLKEKFSEHTVIKFIGGIYDQELLNNLRYYSNLYFHGHQVGGTNPSLLEAMASGALIAAHNNEFNKNILKENGFYFNNEKDIRDLMDFEEKNDNLSRIEANQKEIEQSFNWHSINSKYENLFLKALSNK
jgi:glycosyltransferase involved in cell wall biosynthesis